jgi:hypothetical protein
MSRRLLIFTFAFYLLGVSDIFAQGDKLTTTLSGIITDASTSESLPGASIVLLGKQQNGVLSNAYGFFALTYVKGVDKTIVVSYLGYSSYTFNYQFEKDSVIRIELVPEAIILKDVEVSVGKVEDVEYSEGKILLSQKKIKSTASFGGEPDLFKTLQLFPGVQSGNEGTTNLSVRGGSFDQNLILLDEAPVYNPSHALSFFSIFNVDALQSIEFYKSSIPVKYGGRLSSVVDVKMKEGNRKKNATNGSIGIIASRLTNEGPLGKSKNWSYLISGRYSYAGQVVNGLYTLGQQFGNQTANKSTTDNKINFYDLNLKLNYDLDNRNRFYLSNYSGHDNFYFNHLTSGYDLSWGNNTSTFRWNRVHSKKLFSNTSVVYSDYKYNYRLLNNTQYFIWSASLKEQQVKQDYDLYLNENHYLRFGFGFQNHLINPGKVQPRNETAISKTYSLESKNAIGNNFYLDDTFPLSSMVSVTAGLRYSNFGLRGKRIEYKFVQDVDAPIDSSLVSDIDLYHTLEPRISVKVIQNKASFSISYDRTAQYFHLLANSSVGLPTDLWWPSSANIKPQIADIFVFAFSRPINSLFGFSSALYYKSIQNTLDFKDNARLFVNKYVESQLLQGSGTAYGIELFVDKKVGRLTGSLSYTLSKTYNKIPGVNNGEAYPNRYDKRHNLSTTWRLILLPRLEVSTNFVLTSGGALTIPAGTFVFDGIPFTYYNKRNEYRLPLYHRMDFSLKYIRRGNSDKKFKSYWSIDLYNLYGKKNPFTVYSIQEDYGFYRTQLQAFYLFGIVPSISYNFNF